MCENDFEAAEVTPSCSLPCVTPVRTCQGHPVPLPGSTRLLSYSFWLNQGWREVNMAEKHHSSLEGGVEF